MTFLKKCTTSSGQGLAIGIAMGVAIGVAMGNLPIGVAIGAALGVCMDSARCRTKSGGDESDQHTD